MFTRKTFLQTGFMAGAGISLGAGKMHYSKKSFHDLSAAPQHNAESDETYWAEVAALFDQPTGYTNLENGYFSPQPISTFQFQTEKGTKINKTTSWFMRNEQEAEWESARKGLAGFLGVEAEELAFTRNTTESMNIIISGYPWQKGDEVIIGDQDYGSMNAAFMQAAKRFGIVLKTANVPLIPENDEQVVSAYLSLVTPKTRVIHLTHLINLTGQVIPVRAISRKAHELGLEVMVDAAHSNAQLKFQLPELEADYVGASLHKWLCCPLGTGYLWVKKDKVSKIWPLMADVELEQSNIRKFEHQGTRPVQNWQSISEAIQFHQKIGTALIENRLKYLMKTWCSAVDGNFGIKIITPWNQYARNSAIACVSVNGLTPEELQKKLLKDHNIFTVAINHPVVKGVRVTPHIFTPVIYVQKLSAALLEIGAGLH